MKKMFIFLGDSQPMGYELGTETGKGSDHIPQKIKDKIYYSDLLNYDCRPDLAYPNLLSESLSHDYINLSSGGTSHMRHLDDFQKYLKKYEVPKGSTVFLNANCKHRGFSVDCFTSEALDFMNNIFMTRRTSLSDTHWRVFLNEEGTNIWDFCIRTNVYQNIQSVNHIGLLCDSKELNFLYFHVTPDHLNNTIINNNAELEKVYDEDNLDILSLRPEQKFQPNKPFSEIPDNWLEYHLSIKGHEAVAHELRNEYLNRFA